MNDNEHTRLEMFTRVQAFGATRVDEFAPDSVGRQLFDDLAANITDLERMAAAESSSVGAARQGTATRRHARAQLRRNLQAIYHTAQAMAHELPGLADKFRVPRNNNDYELINAARAFAIDAAPFNAQFVEHELRPDFLEQLNRDINALEDAISAQSTGMGHRTAAAASIDAAIDRGNELVNKLDAVVRNKYRKDRATLAEWTTVTHIDRPPRRNAPRFLALLRECRD